MTDRLREFLGQIRDRSIQVNRAWWDASVSGRESEYRRLEERRNSVDEVYRDPAFFAVLNEARATPSGESS